MESRQSRYVGTTLPDSAWGCTPAQVRSGDRERQGIRDGTSYHSCSNRSRPRT